MPNPGSEHDAGVSSPPSQDGGTTSVDSGADGGSNVWTEHAYARCRQPVGLAGADFDGDGRADLALACANGVALRRGDGMGGFAVETMLNVGSPVSAIVAGDFDGDGALDLAVALSTEVRLLVGDGQGQFVPGRTLGGAGAVDLAAIDTDGDGVLDLVRADALDHRLDVWRHRVTDLSSVSLDVAPEQLVTGDFSGDRVADLVVLSRSGGVVRLLTGDGQGGFAPGPTVDLAALATTFTGALAPEAAVLVDLNGDQRLDLVVNARPALGGDLPSGVDSGLLATWLNDGQGGWKAPSSAISWLGSHSMIATDFNGDGWIDLELVSSVSPDWSAIVVRGNDDGSFQTPLEWAYSSLPVQGDGTLLQLVDLDGKGARAVVMVLPNGLVTVTPLGGPFRPVWTGGVSYDGALIGDLDGDGAPDVVGTSSSTFVYTPYRGDGRGGLTASRDLMAAQPTGHPYYAPQPQVVLGDFEGIGHAQLLDLASGRALLQLDATPVALNGGFFWERQMAVGDLDGDGRTDLVSGPATLSVAYGHSDSVLMPAEYWATLGSGATNVGWGPLAVGDVDGDGKADIVATGGGVINGATGPFFAVTLAPAKDGQLPRVMPLQPFGSNGKWVMQLANGDFDRDHKMDFVVRTYDGQAQLWRSVGDGSFAPLGSSFASTSVVVGDFDADGRLDLASASNGAGGPTLAIGRGNGDGSFAWHNEATALVPLAAGDLDGDGRADLVGSDGNGLVVRAARTVLP